MSIDSTNTKHSPQDNGAAAVESEKSHQEVNDAELVDLAVLGRLAECDAGAAAGEAAPTHANRAVGAVALKGGRKGNERRVEFWLANEAGVNFLLLLTPQQPSPCLLRWSAQTTIFLKMANSPRF